MPQVLLLRHAETSWNVEGRLQGRLESPLTANGERQVEDAAAALPDSFGLVVSSDLERARSTAQPFVDRHGIELRLDHRLRERSWGDWEGFSKSELARRDPDWRSVRPPGFETDEMVWERVRPAIDELRAESRSVLVVTHGGLIGVVVSVFGGTHRGLDNVEGVWLQLDRDATLVGRRWSPATGGISVRTR